MIFQQHQLLGRLTVLQNVLLGRLGHYSAWRTLFPMPADEQAWALDCLGRVGLFEKALVRCDALSGGQQQRVAVARALANRPKLVLADEPTGNVDDAIAVRLLYLFEELNRMGTSVVIATHNEALVSRFQHRQLHLESGKIEFRHSGADG